MGLLDAFRRREPVREPPVDGDRLATLSRRIDDVESSLRRLHVEWTDTLDRLTRLAGRVSKRAERAADPLEAPEATEPVTMSEAARQVALRRSGRSWPGGGGR